MNKKNKKQSPLQNGEELKPIMIKPNMGRMVKPMAKFPDLSGDGKVTQKDILIGRGVIKKPKMEGGKFMTKQYSKTRRNMSKADEKAFEKARTDATIAIGSSIPIGRVAGGLARAARSSRLRRIPEGPILKRIPEAINFSKQRKDKALKAFAEFTKPKMVSPSNRISLAKRDLKTTKERLRSNRRTGIAEAFSRKKNTLRVVDPSTKKADVVVIGGELTGVRFKKTKPKTGYSGTTQNATATGFDMKGRRKQFSKTVTGRDKTGKEIGTTEIKKISRKGKIKTKTRKSLRPFEKADRAAQATGKKGTRGGLQQTLIKKVTGVRPSDLAGKKTLSTFVKTEKPIPRSQSELKRKRTQLRKGSTDGKGNFVKGIRQFKQDKKAGRTDVKLKVTSPILRSGTVNITKKENKLARKNYRKFGSATGRK